MRADKKENQIKVLKEIINADKPLSQRDIANNTWIWKSSVSRAIIEMGQSGAFEEPEIIDFVKLDLELQWLATKEMIRRMKNETEKVNNQDIVRFNETAFKRSTILWVKNNWNTEIKVTFEI